MKALNLIIFLFFIFSVLIIDAQTPLNINYLRKGNTSYNAKEYKKAEIDFRKSLEVKPDYTKAKYNLAASLYKQDQFDESLKLFKEVASLSVDSLKKSKNLFNAGNCLLKQQKFEEAIKYYKDALKHNPGDEEARYNLAYAQKMLKNSNKQQQNQQKKDQQKKDQDQNQNKNQQNQSQDKKNQQQNQQKQQQTQNKNKMKKQDAERMLQAMQQKEKNTKDKVDKQKMIAIPVKTDKDW